MAIRICLTALYYDSYDYIEYETVFTTRPDACFKCRVEKLIAEVRHQCVNKSQVPAVKQELAYFMINIQRMQSGAFCAQWFLIGSGVIPGRCCQDEAALDTR
jgi:hypothetical protein